jgi:hypothetical protein
VTVDIEMERLFGITILKIASRLGGNPREVQRLVWVSESYPAKYKMKPEQAYRAQGAHRAAAVSRGN